ncbi:MAG: SGNH/GDSL hydrolase family protein [Fibromonadales bacterium]|nr:SGNH/GDSL hydrolase family protein [Fibromonadales bacterium]
MNSKITIMLFYLAAVSSLYAQILNVSLLHPFFEKLIQLEEKKNGKVSIVHIGDSHVQPDYFTHAIRQPLQQKFGDGGRGFIFPYNLNKHVAARPYHFTSNAAWKICRNNQPHKCDPGTEFGLSGYGFSTKAEQFVLSVKAREDKHKFNTIKIVSPTASLYSLKQKYQLREPFVLEYHQKKPISSISFFPAKKLELYSLNGLVVEKDAPGLIYHNIGVLGSMVSNFNANPLFFEQLPVLMPDLVIVSLGTNESFNDVTAEKYIEQVELFINNTRKLCQNVPVLITTPPISLLSEKRFNTYILEYTNALLKKDNIAIWDLYSFLDRLMGPEKDISAIKITGDDVHYTFDGYVYQGAAFAKDFLNEYEHYKRSRK